MRYYWLRDKNSQKQMKFFWEKGVNNLADYFTKHHPTKHHRTTRQKYVLDKNPTYLQKSFLANHAHILYENLHHACQNLSSWTPNISAVYEGVLFRHNILPQANLPPRIYFDVRKIHSVWRHNYLLFCLAIIYYFIIIVLDNEYVVLAYLIYCFI